MPTPYGRSIHTAQTMSGQCLRNYNVSKRNKYPNTGVKRTDCTRRRGWSRPARRNPANSPPRRNVPRRDSSRLKIKPKPTRVSGRRRVKEDRTIGYRRRQRAHHSVPPTEESHVRRRRYAVVVVVVQVRKSTRGRIVTYPPVFKQQRNRRSAHRLDVRRKHRTVDWFPSVHQRRRHHRRHRINLRKQPRESESAAVEAHKRVGIGKTAWAVPLALPASSTAHTSSAATSMQTRESAHSATALSTWC